MVEWVADVAHVREGKAPDPKCCKAPAMAKPA